MDPEEKELLRRTLSLSQENNMILRGMRRSARINMFFRFVYFIAFLASLYYSYVYLQPYLNQLQSSYKAVQSAQSSIPNFSNLLKQYQDSQKK